MNKRGTTVISAALVLGLIAVPAVVTVATTHDNRTITRSDVGPIVGMSRENQQIIYGDDGFTLEFFSALTPENEEIIYGDDGFTLMHPLIYTMQKTSEKERWAQSICWNCLMMGRSHLSGIVGMRS